MNGAPYPRLPEIIITVLRCCRLRLAGLRGRPGGKPVIRMPLRSRRRWAVASPAVSFAALPSARSRCALLVGLFSHPAVVEHVACTPWRSLLKRLASCCPIVGSVDVDPDVV